MHVPRLMQPNARGGVLGALTVDRQTNEKWTDPPDAVCSQGFLTTRIERVLL